MEFLVENKLFKKVLLSEKEMRFLEILLVYSEIDLDKNSLRNLMLS